jgi:hypothetical protein
LGVFGWPAGARLGKTGATSAYLAHSQGADFSAGLPALKTKKIRKFRHEPGSKFVQLD